MKKRNVKMENQVNVDWKNRIVKLWRETRKNMNFKKM